MLRAFLFLILFTWTSAYGAQWVFTGEASVERQNYFTKYPEPTRTFDNLVYLKPELDVKFNRRARFYLKPSLRANTSTEESPENYFVNVKEAFLELKTHPIRTRIGMNTHNWGVLDGYSTADNVNGRVFFNPMDPEKRGTGTVDILYDRKSFQLQMLYIPFQSRAVLPSIDSRWLPREFITKPDGGSTGGVEFLQPDRFDYYYEPYKEINNALKNNFGARLTGRIGALDLSLSFFQGVGTNPQVAAIVDLNEGPPAFITPGSKIGLRPAYYRQNMYAATAVRTFKKMILKLESTYQDTIGVHEDIPLSYWQSGLGIEIPWDITKYDVATFFQIYYGDSTKSPDSNLLNSNVRIFDRVGILGTKVAFNSKTGGLFSVLHDYSSDSYFFHALLSRNLTSKTKVSLAGDIIGGRQISLLSTYKNNDRVILTLTYSW